LVIFLGGVAAGIFTVTESAAFACLYTFLLTYLVFRSARIRDIGKVLRNTLKTLAVVLTLIGTAKAFAYMMSDLRIPDQITAALLSVTQNRYVILLIINLLLLLLGCFMDMAPLIMIMTPILLPVVMSPAIGMDPIHFGVMLIFNLAVGLCTPPVGSALFVGCAVGKTTLERTAKAALPMFGMMFIVLMLVTYIPSITMWLPGVLFAK
jgi:tripartite ATP-independent transporter DctM subunit